jgi:hypothetical protein
MNYETACITEIEETYAMDASASWVNEVLEPDQLTASKMRYGRRKLSGRTIFLLWTLRVYVVFMVFIIGLAVWTALHPAA